MPLARSAIRRAWRQASWRDRPTFAWASHIATLRMIDGIERRQKGERSACPRRSAGDWLTIDRSAPTLRSRESSRVSSLSRSWQVTHDSTWSDNRGVIGLVELLIQQSREHDVARTARHRSPPVHPCQPLPDAGSAEPQRIKHVARLAHAQPFIDSVLSPLFHRKNTPRAARILHGP